MPIHDFAINDLVFAKVKGFPYWPAKITNIDKETYKTVVKYIVLFFGTNETNSVNIDSLCHYEENRFKYCLEAVAAKYKNNYKLALQEVDKAWRCLKSGITLGTSRKTVNSPSLLQGRNSPNPHLEITPSYKQTKVTHKQNIQTILSLETPGTSNMASNIKTHTTKDASVNTTIDLDRDFQLHAVTEKCISLEKTIIELKTNKNNDFHTQILKQELKKYKAENLTLLEIIETLKIDNKLLEERIGLLELNDQKCLNCYPLLNKHDRYNTQEVRTVPNLSKTKGYHQDTFKIQCENRYNGLFLDSSDTTDATNGSTNDAAGKRISTKNNKNPGLLKSKLTVISQNKSTETKTKGKPQLIIMADSHGRQIGNLIEQKTSVNVCSYVKPGAKFGNVVEEIQQITEKLTGNDHLLVIAGTNNIQSTSTQNLMNDIHRVVNESHHTNLIMSTLPMRYDQPDLDLQISTVNTEIENIVLDHPNVKLLPLHLFPRHLYTEHGLHFNKRGKARIAETVAKLLHQKRMDGVTNVSSGVFPTVKDAITVVEEEMSKVIEKYEDDSTVGLAHSISRDFHNIGKHMSAGVAVVFRKKFGRPHMSDLIYTNLALQKAEKGSLVYSLVTKDEYCGKPNKKDYNDAFHQLAFDFKSKNLKVLVCSAMGCIRDRIQPQHFVDNIIKFHNATSAKIYIVSHDQVARRKLWNGLTHNEFVRRLRELIAERLKKQEEDTSPQENSQRDELLDVSNASEEPQLPNTPLESSNTGVNSVMLCENGHFSCNSDHLSESVHGGSHDVQNSSVDCFNDQSNLTPVSSPLNSQRIPLQNPR